MPGLLGAGLRGPGTQLTLAAMQRAGPQPGLGSTQEGTLKGRLLPMFICGAEGLPSEAGSQVQWTRCCIFKDSRVP